MQICAISTCENSSLTASENVSFHSFPLGNANLLKKWVCNMKLSEVNRPLSYYLCDKHFLPTSFHNGNLKEDAVPLMEPVDDDSHSFVALIDEEKKKSIVEEHIGVFLCRVCCCNIEEDKMVSVFDESKRVFEKIKSCLPLLVEDCNDLPRHLCDKCFKQLERMYSIRSLAVTSEILFFHFLASVSVKDNETVIETEDVEADKNKLWGEEQLHLKGPVTCNLCDTEFVDMDRFDSHMEEHGVGFCENPPSDMLNVVCSSCGLIFEAESVYREHKRRQKYECVACDVILESYCEMKSHECIIYDQSEMAQIMEVTTDDGHEIEDEEKVFHREHSKNSQKKRKYYCSPCNRQFQRHVNWVKHKIKHEKDELYECKECGQQFEKLRLLNQHREKLHKNSQNWICRYCGKHTTTKLSLNIHERIHTGIKPFICEWCGNAFRSKANLSQHHAKHTGIRRHSCNVCGKKFSRKSFVTTHMRVHTGERPFACDICEQRFTQVGDMRRHRRRHIMQQQSQSNNVVGGVIIQQMVLKDEKCDIDADIVGNSSISNSSIQLNSKISIADIRAHFL
ncbi:uncharacterized protein LOC142323910 isoform X2 [Lycorma delicatula]|uniref:uncharacterized protein LOC142323910 isoform X2 n=1 Tax=Lycorma delicatula TaxID=130591 RepID=UPI003F516BDF